MQGKSRNQFSNLKNQFCFSLNEKIKTLRSGKIFIMQRFGRPSDHYRYHICFYFIFVRVANKELSLHFAFIRKFMCQKMNTWLRDKTSSFRYDAFCNRKVNLGYKFSTLLEKGILLKSCNYFIIKLKILLFWAFMLDNFFDIA